MLAPQKIPPSFFDEREDTVLTWLGMAGALINARGTILLVDPLITTVRSNGQLLCESEYRLKVPLPIKAQEITEADAVLYTHADSDHFGRLTAQTFATQLQCQFLATPPVRHVLREMGVTQDRITTVRDFESIQVGCVEIVGTPALHDWQEENPWKRGDCCGYILKTPDATIWHPGDTRLTEELLKVQDVDVLFFDVAAVDAHLGPEGSAQLLKSSGAKVAIAYHYGTFDLPPGSFGGCGPQDCLPYITGLSANFLQLNPGELLRLPPRP